MRIMEPGKIYHTVYIDFMVQTHTNFMVQTNTVNKDVHYYTVWIQLTEDSVGQNPIRLASDHYGTDRLKGLEKFVYDFLLREVYSKYKDVKLVITER